MLYKQGPSRASLRSFESEHGPRDKSMSRAYNMNYTIIDIYLISINKNDFRLQRHHLQSKQVDATCSRVWSARMMEFPPPAQGDGRATQGNSLRRSSLNCGTRIRVTKPTFFNICRHHPTLKFKAHATDDERYVWGIDGVPLTLAELI